MTWIVGKMDGSYDMSCWLLFADGWYRRGRSAGSGWRWRRRWRHREVLEAMIVRKQEPDARTSEADRRLHGNRLKAVKSAQPECGHYEHCWTHPPCITTTSPHLILTSIAIGVAVMFCTTVSNQVVINCEVCLWLYNQTLSSILVLYLFSFRCTALS